LFNLTRGGEETDQLAWIIMDFDRSDTKHSRPIKCPLIPVGREHRSHAAS